MEVAGLSRTEGGNVAVWADANAPSGTGPSTPTGDGHYFLVNRYSGLCLAVDEGTPPTEPISSSSRTRH
jgi:alpha-L-fucosidase